jgi:hypothetical protein
MRILKKIEVSLPKASEPTAIIRGNNGVDDHA